VFTKVLFFLSLLAATTALVTDSRNFGQTYNCSNTDFYLVTWNGPLSISVDMSFQCEVGATVLFDLASSSPQIPVTLGAFALTIGSASGPLFIGFLLDYTGTVNNVTITWSGILASAAAAAMQRHSQMGLVHLNSDNEVIGFIPLLEQQNTSISVMLPSPGTFAFIHIESAVQTTFSAGIVLAPNVTQTFEFKSWDGSYTELTVRIKASMPTTLLCHRYLNHSAKNSLPTKGLNVFFTFSLFPVVTYEVELLYTFSDEQLIETEMSDPTSLQWYYFSEETSSWQMGPRSLVDLTEKSVTQSTNSSLLADWTIAPLELPTP